MKVGKYMIRPLLSLKRLYFDESKGKVRYQYSRHGSQEELMDYLEFIARVTSHIPDKGQVMIRYYGLYSNAHRGKIRKAGGDPSHPPIIEDEIPFVPQRGWAEMIRKFHEVDPLCCPTCSGQMRIIAVIKKNPRDHLLFKWTYLYGLRVSEAIALRLSDILPDLNSPKEIYINRLKGGVSRHFPIRSEETIHLKRWLRKRAQMKNADGNPWLFLSSHSVLHHMSAMNVEKMMVKYGELAGLKRDKSHPHTLRHSCAIHMLMNGADIYDVQSHLGHTSVTTTIQY